MKKVILFRHAMAAYSALNEPDHDRALTPKGIVDAQNMGIYLKNKKEFPELVISSSAIRAKNTAKHAIKSGQWKCEFLIENKIYGGNPNYLIDLLNRQPDKVNIVCLVGHEPHFSKFVLLTTGKLKKLPTASMAILSFDCNSWSQLYFNSGKLNSILEPNFL